MFFTKIFSNTFQKISIGKQVYLIDEDCTTPEFWLAIAKIRGDNRVEFTSSEKKAFFKAINDKNTLKL